MYHIVEVYFPIFRGCKSYNKCFVKFRTTREHDLYEEVKVTGIKDGKEYVGYIVNIMWVDVLPENLAKTIL